MKPSPLAAGTGPSPGMKILKAIVSRTYGNAVIAAIWYGGQRITWPRPLAIIGEIVGVVALAGVAHFLVWWTRSLRGSSSLIESAVGVGIRVIPWVGAAVVVGLWMVAAPAVGMLGGVLLLYMVGDAWREKFVRLFRWIRREGVALRRDDPNYRPAVVQELWPRRKA